MDASTRIERCSPQNAHKDNSPPSSSITPPPAYTPRSQLGFQLLSRIQQAQASSMANGRITPLIRGRDPLTTVMDEVDDSDLDSQDGSSPICLRINTSVVVNKSNNLICLMDTPASHANAIARAVVQAIQENSSGQCGIPMIDEDGRPRPIKIEVDAGITVDGANNVIGSEEMIHKVLEARKHSRECDGEEDETQEGVPKRPCRRS